MRDEDEVNQKIENLEGLKDKAIADKQIRKYEKLANYVKALRWVNEYHDDDLKV